MKKFIAVVSVMMIIAAFIGCGEVTLTRGTIEDKLYLSDFSGLTFTIPDNWYALDDAAISKDYSYSRPTNSELKEMDSSFYFCDAMFWDSTQGKNLVQIYYTSLYDGITDEQIKTRKEAEVKSLTFDDVSYFDISGVKWAKIHSQTGDLHCYFAWRCDVSKGPREVLYIETENVELCDTLLSCFSYS